MLRSGLWFRKLALPAGEGRGGGVRQGPGRRLLWDPGKGGQRLGRREVLGLEWTQAEEKRGVWWSWCLTGWLRGEPRSFS